MDKEELAIFKRIGVAATAVFLFAASCNSIDTGTVGVVKHFGAAQHYVLNEGINFTRPWPFADVIDVSIAVGKTEAKAAAASKDLQGVHTKVTVQWSVEPGLAPKLVQGFGYYDGAWTNGVISPAIQEVVKAVSARYTAEQLITQRSEVKLGIEQGLVAFINSTLVKKGCRGAIQIANVAVTDFEFSKEFDKSIEAKVKAEQEALKAKNEKVKRITDAEAKAKEQTLSAEAEAYSIEVRSKAKADALKREAAALMTNPQLIQLRTLERWDGKLPTYTGGAMPLMNIK